MPRPWKHAIMAGAERAAPDIAVRMLANAEVNKTDEDRLIGLVAKRAKVGKRAIGQRLKDLRNTAKATRINEARADTQSKLPEITVVQGLRHEAADAGIAAMHAANSVLSARRRIGSRLFNSSSNLGRQRYRHARRDPGYFADAGTRPEYISRLEEAGRRRRAASPY